MGIPSIEELYKALKLNSRNKANDPNSNAQKSMLYSDSLVDEDLEGYQILRPIAVSNPQINDFSNFRTWAI